MSQTTIMTSSRVTIVVPSYNNEEYVDANLLSICGQSYQNKRIIYINDASTDRTSEVAKKWLLDGKGEVIDNQKRLYAMENLYQVIQSLPEDDIVVVVDGDDWLARSDVIDQIVKQYDEHGAMLTFGRYVKYPTFEPGPIREAYRNLSIREEEWFLSHVKTFYAKLFQKIRLNDLMIDGAFVKAASDVAMMWPMYEMAGEHVHQMDETLYVYNLENVDRVAISQPGEQQHVVDYLRKQSPYERV